MLERINDPDQLIEDMVKSDMDLFKRDIDLIAAGHKVINFHE